MPRIIAGEEFTSHDREEFLRSLSLFRDALLVEKLASSVEVREYGANESVYSEGDRVEGFFLVVSGSVALTRGNYIVAEKIGQGEFFGEYCIIRLEKLYTVDAVARERRTRLLVVGADLVGLDDAQRAMLFRELARELSERLDSANDRARKAEEEARSDLEARLQRWKVAAAALGCLAAALGVLLKVL